MVKINSNGGGDGQDPRDNGDYQAKMAELLRREQQAIKRQVRLLFLKRFEIFVWKKIFFQKTFCLC